MRCPNKNHPDWIELVRKIGFDRAYEEYIKNNDDIPDPSKYEEEHTGVNYTLKIANAILEKGDDFFDKFFKNNPEKFYSDLIKLAGKDQVNFLRSLNPQVDSASELISLVLANMSYAVQIEPSIIHQPVLTVPGGVNPTENEIRTPTIVPSIPGHTQYSTKYGIGWFKSDEQFPDKNTKGNVTEVKDSQGNIVEVEDFDRLPRTRRVLEVRSDLFQKARKYKALTASEERIAQADKEDNLDKVSTDLPNEDAFLQLLIKNDNWTTFFIHAIIQDSYKKGYKKIHFPTGPTASRIQGHESTASILERIKELEIDIKDFNENFSDVVTDTESRSSFRFEENGVAVVTGQASGPNAGEGDRIYRIERSTGNQYPDKEEFFKVYKDLYNQRVTAELARLKDHLEQDRISHVPIYNFYENTVYNILAKRYGRENINRIKDTFDNEWYEIDATLRNDTILLSLPIEASQESLEKTFSDLILPGFTAYTQNEAINLLTEQVVIQIKLTPGISLNQALQNVVDEIRELNDPHYNSILSNINKLRDFVKDKLDRIGLFNREYIMDSNNLDIEGDSVSDSFHWKDDWVFKFDSKANAQKKIKEFLLFIPKVDKEGNFVVNEFNTNSYMPYDQVFEDLKAILADTPNTWQAMRSKLEENQKSKPWIYGLLKLIDEHNEINKVLTGQEGDVQQLINQFVTTFSSTYGGFKTILHDIYNQIHRFRIIDTDQNSATKSLLNKWKSFFNDSDFIHTDNEGNPVINNERVQDFIKNLDQAATDPIRVRKLLSALGIDLSEATFNTLIHERVGGLTYKEQFTSDRGLFKIIKSRLAGRDAKDLEEVEIINPVINNSALRTLASLEVENNPSIYSNSFINGEGNTVYSYALNKFITKQLQKLKNHPEYLDKLMQLTFHAPNMVDNTPLYKTWLWELKNNEQFKAIFELSPLDTLKPIDDKGTTISQMGDIDHEITRLSLFQNRNRNLRGVGRISNYLFTVPSKTTAYVVTGDALDPNIGNVQGENFDIGKDVKNALYNIALTELKRINSVFNRKVSNSRYKTGSKYFYFFPVLNKETTPEIWNKDGTVKLPTVKVGDQTVEQIIKSKIEDVIKQEIRDKVAEWKSIGIIVDNKLVYVDGKYKARLKGDDNWNNLFAAADFIINNTLAEFNIHQMFSGDPAQYYKNSVEATWDEIGKRLSAMIAPGRELALDSENEKFISVKAKDREGAITLNKAQLKEILGDSYAPYEDLNGTDAQEFTTLKEHLTIMYKLGQLPTKIYKDLVQRIDKGEDVELTKEELQTVLQPMKPVYANVDINTEEDILALEYIKSSSIPLLPQFTKGLELDKLRIALEKLERKQGLPVRLTFDSATKVGGVPSTTIFNDDGTVKDNLNFESSFKLLNRSGFLIQQDIPYDPNVEEVVKSTQVTKLIFDALLAVNGFEYKGDQYNGEELRKLYDDLHGKLFNESKESLYKDILDVYGRIDLKKLQPILLNEARLRGYSPAEIASLSLTPDGKFEYPFWIHSKKFEALITSLFTNNIVKQKMHGKSYVLVAEEGNLGKSKGVIYTDSYDPTTGLKPMRMENGEVKPAQILVPWKFKADIKNYTRPDGSLDTDLVPHELLERFAFRIPNQGHQSMSLVEVVGFLPEVMGDVVIASRNYITQMGSDFDVDKLYIYDYYTIVAEKGGKITKDLIDNSNVIKNQILDIYKAVAKNPAVFKEFIKPLSNTKDTESAQYLKKVTKRKINNYLSPSYKKIKYLESVDGKNMISIMALANTLNPLLQRTADQHEIIAGYLKGKPIYDSVVFGDENGKAVRLSNLSTAYTWRGNKKNTTISSDLSAAVDNEKDPILYYINANPITAPARVALQQLGFEADHINYLTAQPIIREFVRNVQKGRSITESVFTPSEVYLYQLINTIRDQYLKTLTEKDQQAYDESALKYYPITTKELKDNITKRDLRIDLITLLKFQQVYEIGTSLQSIQRAINIESGGVGKNVVEIKSKVNRVNKLFKLKNISNVPGILGEFGNNGLAPTTYSGHLLKDGLFAANTKLSAPDLFQYNTRSFEHILEEYERLIGEVNDDRAIELWENLKSFVFTSNLSIKERQDIFFGKNSLAKRIRKYLKTKDGYTNQFLVRLNLEFRGGTYPDLISYNAAKEEFVDEIGIYQGLINLLINKDDEAKRIGRDLVKYFFLNGGIQKAREWGKYIHPNVLANLGYIGTFKSIDFQELGTIGALPGPYSISTMMLQYVQHRPWLAKQIDPDSIKNKKVNLLKDIVILPYANIDSLTYLLTGEEFSPVISLKDKTAPKGYRLFLYNKTQDNGDVEYKQIAILGLTNYVEYNKNSSIGISLVNPNYNEKKTVKAPVKNALKNDTKSILNDAGIANEYVGSLPKALEKVQNFKELVPILRAFNLVGDVSVDTELNAVGNYNVTNKSIRLNPTVIRDTTDLRYQVERTLLHETVHAITAEAFRSKDKLTPKQLAAVEKISVIYNGLVKRILIKDDLSAFKVEEYREFENLLELRRSKQPLTEQQEKRLRELRPYYYGLVNVDEFVSELFTNKYFQEKLGNIAWDGNKSILDRLIDLITEFLNAIGIKHDSVAAEVIKEVINLLPEEPKTEKTKPVKKSWFQKNGDNPPPVLEDIGEAITPEYSKLIHEFESRLKAIDNSISKAFNQNEYVRAEQLIARKKEIEDELKKLEDNKIFSVVLNLANKDLDTVSKLLSLPGLSHNDINYALRVIKTWVNAPDLVLEESDILDNNQRAKDMYQVQARASELYRKWSIIARASLLKAVKETTGLNTITKEVLDSQDKINAITANLMDISRTGNTLLSVMAEWMKKSAYKANLESEEIASEIDTLVENLSKNEDFIKDKYYTFAQRTSKGELTGELIHPLSFEYYNTRNTLIEEASAEQNKDVRKERWKKYFQWVRDNHTFIDVRKLFTINNEGLYTYSPNNEYIDILKKRYGDNFEDYLQEQKDKIESYNSRLQIKIDSLDKEDPNSFRDLEKWKAKYDPSIYLRNIYSKDRHVSVVDGEFIKNEGHEFVFKRAKKQWEDKQYQKIQESKELREFYNYLTKTLNRLYGYIPSSYKQHITMRNIPSIPRSLMEVYNEEGMSGAFTKLNNNFIEAISTDDLETQTRQLQDPITGKPEQELHVRFVHNLSPEQKSYDLGKVLKVFALEALTYKHKSTVEDSVKLAYSILQDSKEAVKSPIGTPLINRFGENTKVKDNKNLYEQVEYAIEAWYGNRKTLQGVTSKTIYTNKAKSKVAAVMQAIKDNNITPEVAKYIKEMEKSLTPFEAAQVDAIADEEDRIRVLSNLFLEKNTRYVTGSKIGDVVLQYMQLKGMGFNAFSSVTNVVFGWFSNFNYAMGSVDFTLDQMFKANGIMLSSTLKSSGIESNLSLKINQMMNRFDVLKELNDAAYRATTNTNKVRKGMSKLGPYELQRRGEYFVQGQTMIALALNTKVKAGDQEMSLFEAWDKPEFRDNLDWNGSVDNKEHNKELYKFKLKLDQILKSLHGNYDPNSPVRIKKGVLGRAAMQFRSWVAEGFASRVESKKFDLLLGREREGRWRTYYTLGFKKSLQILSRVLRGKGIEDLVTGKYKDTVVENMKRNLAEIYTKLTLFAMFTLLKYLDLDDDDEWGKKSMNFTLNQILRLQDDIEFYYSPLALENITQNFVPVFTLFRDSAKFIDALEKGVHDGEWEYKSGKKRGENRILWTGLKLFPGSSSLASFINKTENEESFRK